MASSDTGAAATATEVAPMPTQILVPKVDDLSTDLVLNIFAQHTGRPFDALEEPEHPFFVLLVGAPGTGKSSALRYMEYEFGLRPTDAVLVSRDTLIESLLPFREETFAIYQEAKAKGDEKILNESIKVYNKYNKAVSDIFDRALMIAIKSGKNVIYEKTASQKLVGDIQAILKLSGKPYRAFAIYTRADAAKAASLLKKRVNKFASLNPPHGRYVPPGSAFATIPSHNQFFVEKLFPEAEAFERTIALNSTQNGEPRRYTFEELLGVLGSKGTTKTARKGKNKNANTNNATVKKKPMKSGK